MPRWELTFTDANPRAVPPSDLLVRRAGERLVCNEAVADNHSDNRIRQGSSAGAGCVRQERTGVVETRRPGKPHPEQGHIGDRARWG